MKVWVLWSSRVDFYSDHEVVALFRSRKLAETVRAGLIGKQCNRGMAGLCWEDDEDFPDLYVRPHRVH